MAEQGGYIITGLLNGIKAGLQPIIDLFTMLKENAKKVLQESSSSCPACLQATGKKARNGIQEIFKGVWNGIVGLLEGAVNLIIDGVNWLISKLNMVSFTTPDWLDVIKPGLGGKTFGISIPNIERVALPRLATGAVIPPNREFLGLCWATRSAVRTSKRLLISSGRWFVKNSAHTAAESGTVSRPSFYRSTTESLAAWFTSSTTRRRSVSACVWQAQKHNGN